MTHFISYSVSLSIFTSCLIVGCIEGKKDEPSRDREELEDSLTVDMSHDGNSDIDQGFVNTCFGEGRCDQGLIECDVNCDDPACIDHSTCLIDSVCDMSQMIYLEASQRYTLDPGTTSSVELGSCGGNGPETVFRFNPEETGVFCITTVGSEADTVLYVRESCADTDSELACNDDEEGTQSSVSVALDNGRDYFVFVDHFSDAEVGAISVMITAGSCEVETEEEPERQDEDCDSEGDENDNGWSDCDDRACLDTPQCAQPLAPTHCEENSLIELNGWGSVMGNTDGAIDELHGSCGGQATGEQVYRFTPPENGPFCVSTEGSAFDTLLHVRKTCHDPTSEMSCNDDYLFTRAALTVNGVANNAYYLIVDGYRVTGSYTLTVTEGSCPPAPEEVCDQEGDEDFDGQEDCDDFDCRFAESCIMDLPLACELDVINEMLLDEVIVGSSESAPMELNGSCGGRGSEVTYRFTPVDTGDYCISSEGSAYDTVLYVRSQCFQPNSELGCNDDFNNTASALSLAATAGVEYFVILDSFANEGGEYTLTVNEGPCVADRERCFREGDEDANGLEGCDDPACTDLPECAPPVACIENELIPLASLGSLSGQLPNRPSEDSGSCGGNGAEEVYTFSINGDGPICFRAQGVEVDPVLYIRTQCDRSESEVACNDDYEGLNAALTLNAEASTIYYLYVDTFSGSGEYTLDMSVGVCSPPIYAERCDMEGDEDGNGLADCDDPVCAGELSCLMPIGALACDPSALILIETMTPYLGETINSPRGEEGSCGGSASEVVHAITATSSGEVCARLDFANFDARLYVRSTCALSDSELGCDESENEEGVALTLNVEEGATYYLFVDGEENGSYLLSLTEGACSQ